MATGTPTSEGQARCGRVKWVWALRVAATGSFTALMALEWSLWPNGSPLLGPLGIIWYNGADPCTLTITAFLLPVVFAFPLKPCLLTALLSLLGLMAWTFLGVIAIGIGC
jgi:hypothetical protein